MKIPKRRADRELILTENKGLLTRVAQECGVTPETVSRVFHGKISRSPKVQAALERQLRELEATPSGV